MSLRLCMLFILIKHLYTFYIYVQYLSRGIPDIRTFGDKNCSERL